MKRTAISPWVHATRRTFRGGAEGVCGVQARHLGAAFPLAIREPRVILRQYYAVFMLSDRSFVRGAAACEEIQFAVTAEWKKRIRKREGGHKLREITLFSIGNPWI